MHAHGRLVRCGSPSMAHGRHGAFLIGCAVIVAVGCSGARSEAPKEEGGHAQTTNHQGHSEATNHQEHTEATKEEERTEATKQQGHTEATEEQEHSPETASEEDQCGRMRTIDLPHGTYITNDVPGCPKGGRLFGTDEPDQLDGEDGEDEVRGLGATDTLLGGYGDDFVAGGEGSDVVYGGLGRDDVAGDRAKVVFEEDDKLGKGRWGEDVLDGGGGHDELYATDRHRDKLYCGEGRDEYAADSIDYIANGCEVRVQQAIPFGDDTP
jgi:hypothetical protein